MCKAGILEAAISKIELLNKLIKAVKAGMERVIIMGTKKTCISNTKGNGCSKLNVEKCRGESCSFACTKEEAEASHKKAFERLSSLDKEIQMYISNKYYGGKMPWLNCR